MTKRRGGKHEEEKMKNLEEAAILGILFGALAFIGYLIMYLIDGRFF